MSMLMNKSGALLGTGGQRPEEETESRIQAAIAANMWGSFASMPTQYEVGGKRNSQSEELRCLVLELGTMTLAVQAFGDYIGCVGADPELDQDFLRAKLQALVDASSHAFKQLA